MRARCPGIIPVTSASMTKPTPRKFEQAWNIEPGGLNRKLGLTTTEILSERPPGGVRALYIMGENPMMSEPNLNLTRHHMEQLEFLVAQDLFINESGAFADVFLPAASWAEKDGTFTNTDRRVQRVRQAIQPRRTVPRRLADHLRPGQTAGEPAWADRTAPIGIMRTRPRCWKRWAASSRNMPGSIMPRIEKAGPANPGLG